MAELLTIEFACPHRPAITVAENTGDYARFLRTFLPMIDAALPARSLVDDLGSLLYGGWELDRRPFDLFMAIVPWLSATGMRIAGITSRVETQRSAFGVSQTLRTFSIVFGHASYRNEVRGTPTSAITIRTQVGDSGDEGAIAAQEYAEKLSRTSAEKAKALVPPRSLRGRLRGGKT